MFINNINAKHEKFDQLSYRFFLDRGNIFLQVPHDQHNVQLKNCCYRKNLPTLEIFSISTRWHQAIQKFNFPFLNNKVTFAEEHLTIFSFPYFSFPACLWLDTVLKVYDFDSWNVLDFWAAYINP